MNDQPEKKPGSQPEQDGSGWFVGLMQAIRNRRLLEHLSERFLAWTKKQAGQGKDEPAVANEPAANEQQADKPAAVNIFITQQQIRQQHQVLNQQFLQQFNVVVQPAADTPLTAAGNLRDPPRHVSRAALPAAELAPDAQLAPEQRRGRSLTRDGESPSRERSPSPSRSPSRGRGRSR